MIKTLEYMESVMTLYFVKLETDQKGEIRYTYTGDQDFIIFDKREEEYKLIYDRIVLQMDQYVLDNYHKFKIVNGELMEKVQKQRRRTYATIEV